MAELSALISRGNPPAAVGPVQMGCEKRSVGGSDHPHS